MENNGCVVDNWSETQHIHSIFHLFSTVCYNQKRIFPQTKHRCDSCNNHGLTRSRLFVTKQTIHLCTKCGCCQRIRLQHLVLFISKVKRYLHFLYYKFCINCVESNSFLMKYSNFRRNKLVD